MLAIRLPQEIENRLEALAQQTGRTKSFYAREAIVDHLEDLEVLYLAESRVQALRHEEEQAVSLDDIIKRSGLAD